MRGGTFFSGIDAPEVSAPHIQWMWRAEIDRFANAVSEFHRPGLPNLGNMEEADFDGAEPVDIIVFGSPCQSFSVAGKRLGLDDPRGNLALVALAAVARIRPRWIVFENVPGLFSSYSGSEHAEREVREGDVGQCSDGEENRDLAAFFARLRECGYLGCWRVLDAQFAGVPQRRRRLFFVGYLGDWRPAAAVLFERESLQGNTAPRRKAGEGIAKTLAGGSGERGYGSPSGSGGGGVELIAGTLDAHYGDKMGLENQHVDAGCPMFVTHSLRAEGFDASEDGTGRGTPLVAFDCKDLTMGTSRVTSALTTNGDANHAGGRQAICFTVKDSGGDAGDMAPTLRAGGHDRSHANAGVMPAVAIQSVQAVRDKKQNDIGVSEDGSMYSLTARDRHAVAFAQNQRGELRTNDISPQLTVGGGKPGQGYPAVATLAIRRRGESCDLKYRQDGTANAVLTPNGGRAGIGVGAIQNEMTVRRLTPRECERLQGFPDDYTRVPYRNKPAGQCPDGPRYKALGNSMAVPVIGWILGRIKTYEARNESN